jgi:FAD/FMN-containing dehydrogenase
MPRSICGAGVADGTRMTTVCRIVTCAHSLPSSSDASTGAAGELVAATANAKVKRVKRGCSFQDCVAWGGMVEQAINLLIEAARAITGPKGVIDDAANVAPWLTDWRGRYHGRAEAIIAPASTAELAAIVTLANTHGVPLVPQGGNTGMVGGATPPDDGSALILSLRRMNRIRHIDADAGVAVAEAGVILSHLHDAALAQGRRFPLTLGGKGSATIGGLVSTNAGGTQVLRFGTMRALTLGIEAVLPDGTIHDGLAVLKKDNRGYDLAQLLIGAEGTLGIVTAAALKLVPVPADRAVAWVGLGSPQAALRLLRFLESRSDGVESFEIVPADSMALVLRHIPGTRAPLAHAFPWLVLIELTGAMGAAVRLEALLAEAHALGMVQDATISASERQADAFWHLRDSISEAERADGPATQHDISVPVDSMPAFMIDAARMIEAEFPGVTASAFGHLGDGNVHFHVRAPQGADPETWRAAVGEPASHRVHDLVIASGGSISAEHGIGQMKRDELLRLSSPARMVTLRAIKAAMDPKGIMNPGKLVSLV